MREGWIAAWDGGTHRLPLGARAEAKALGRGRPFVASADTRCVWVSEDDGVWAEYDGVDDRIVRRVHISHRELWGAVDRGLLVRNPRTRTIEILDPEEPTRETEPVADSDVVTLEVVLAVGNLIVLARSQAHLAVLDVSTGRAQEIVLPLWRRHRDRIPHASISPDRCWLAVTGDAIVGPIPFDIDPKERARRKRQGSALVLVDLVGGRAAFVDGYFEGSAYPPVWSSDGSWVFFGAPHEEVIYATALASEPALRRVEGAWRKAPMPLLDLASRPV